MGNIYIGNSGIARKVDKIYVGVNGIARKVQKIYVGDANGKAREVYGSFDPFIWNDTVIFTSDSPTSIVIFRLGSDVLQNARDNGCNAINSFCEEAYDKENTIGGFNSWFTVYKSGGSSKTFTHQYRDKVAHISIANATSVECYFYIVNSLSSGMTSAGRGNFYFEYASSPIS